MHSLIKFIADECVTQSTFKSDVQSTLLGMIHELVKRQMSVLLAPTAGLWAKDMVDFVLTETGDKKVKFTFTIFPRDPYFKEIFPSVTGIVLQA